MRRSPKIPLEVGERRFHGTRLKRDDDVDVAGEKPLVLAKDLPHPPLQAIAHHGIAHPAGGHHGKARQVKPRVRRTSAEGKDKGRAMLAAALVAHGREVRLASQMLPGAESHGRGKPAVSRIRRR